MKFRITRHSGHSAPTDALDLLWGHLGTDRNEVSFTKVGEEIRAAWAKDAPVSMEADERIEIGRRAVLNVVSEVCEGSPGLVLDWYAVSPQR